MSNSFNLKFSKFPITLLKPFDLHNNNDIYQILSPKQVILGFGAVQF